jgi:microcystin-dependent protein
MSPFIAEIKLFAGNFAPRDYAMCNGQLLPISQNQALFSLIGTMYGGNGTTTFGLPDLRGRVPIHQGQGPGLTNRVLGEMGGSETVTLTANELPPHTHNLQANTGPGTSVAPVNGAVLAASTARDKVYGTAVPNAVMSAQSIGPAGSGLPHANMQPYLAVNFIIAIQGIFPSRN